MEGDNLTRWRRAPFSSSTELRASGRPTLRNRWRSVVLGRSVLMLAVRSCTGRALVARSTRCLELVRPLDVPLNAPKARPMPAALHGCPSGLVRGKNSKNSKNFRELQALDFVASLCALDRLHLETNGCGLGGVVGRSARHSDSILADLTRAEFENISRGPAVALVATLRD